MNKRILIIAGIIALAIFAGIVYLVQQPKVEPNQDISQTNNTPAPSTESQQPNTSSQPGAYIDYESDVIANTKGTKLLFFYAPWCPQCRALEADIKAKGVPENVTIIKVDYDSNQELRKKYGVTLQTTVVRIDDNGDLIKKYVAYDDPSLSAVTKELL